MSAKTWATLAALACSLTGCGRQELDLLSQVQDTDACLSFTTQSDCVANMGLGCWFQPNAEGCLSTDPSCVPLRRRLQLGLARGPAMQFLEP